MNTILFSRSFEIINLFIIVFLSVLLKVYITSNLFHSWFIEQQVFFTELINQPVLIPVSVVFLFGSCNIALLYLIGKRLISSKFGYIASLLYAFSPWILYTEATRSVFVFVLTGLLISFYGMLLNKENPWLSIILITLGTLTITYTAPIMWLILISLIIGLRLTGYFQGETWFSLAKKKMLVIIAFVHIPLLLMVLLNTQAVTNYYKNNITLFNDVGIVNSVNVYRGESVNAGFGAFSRVFENRYVYLSLHSLIQFLKQLTPVFYFTPEVKMYGFSFTPPILTPVLIPFLVGLYKIINSLKGHKLLGLFIISISLTFPSTVSQYTPDLSKLIIFSPIVFFIISYGIVNYLITSKERLIRIMFIGIILLTLAQGLVIVTDIGLREPVRLEKSMERH